MPVTAPFRSVLYLGFRTMIFAAGHAGRGIKGTGTQGKEANEAGPA